MESLTVKNVTLKVAPCEISLEQTYARRLGAELGDTAVGDVEHDADA